MINNKTILITGSGGFIGHHLAKKLSLQGNNVIGTFLKEEKNPFLNESIYCDIKRFDDVKKLAQYKIDHIFHLAGIPNVKESIVNPINDFNANTLGVINILEVFKKKEIQSFNFTSTVSVLDPTNNLPLDENAKLGPTTPYGASKMSSEAYCKVYNLCYNIPTRIVRLFNIYGPGKRGLVVYDIIKKLLLKPEVLELYGDGNQIRDFLYIEDAVDGLEIIAENGKNGDVYNLGSGVPVSIIELSKKILYSMGLNNVKIKTTNRNYKGELLKWYADIHKIEKIGFEQKINLEKGLKQTINWIKK